MVSRKEAKNCSEIYFFQHIWKGQTLKKISFDENNFFLSNQWNGTNITKNYFLPQNDTAKLSFSVVLKHFCGNWLKTSLCVQKRDYLRKKLRITQRIIFSKQIWKGPNPKENFNLIELFVVKPVRRKMF